MVGKFLARAVADDCVTPAFVDHGLADHHLAEPRSHAALQLVCDDLVALREMHANIKTWFRLWSLLSVLQAHGLIAAKGGMARLDQIWGLGGALQCVHHPLTHALNAIEYCPATITHLPIIHPRGRPVWSVIKEMGLILAEYALAGDVGEALKCLHELYVPHFHHEARRPIMHANRSAAQFVFEAVLFALEHWDKSSAVVALLAQAHASSEIAADQLSLVRVDGVLDLRRISHYFSRPDRSLRSQGLKRISDDIADISLDIPKAAELFASLQSQIAAAGVAL